MQEELDRSVGWQELCELQQYSSMTLRNICYQLREGKRQSSDHAAARSANVMLGSFMPTTFQ